MAGPDKQENPIARLIEPLSAAEIKQRVAALAGPADQALKDNLHSHVSFIEEVAGYIIFSGGKRLRPVLYLLACSALGGPREPAQASLFEFLHAATLLHDDVIDEAGLRRGRPAARTEYGNDAVILVGDFLFSKSYSLAAATGDPAFMRALTDCTTYMAEGQVLELLHTGDLQLAVDGYLAIIRAKTAVLLAAACQMGAIRSGASPEEVKLMYDYGMELGIAFQMVDDALDYVGTMHEFGKPVGHDLAEGKITLPFIHARDNAEAGKSTRLLELAEAGKRQPEVLEEAKDIVRQAGGVEHTMREATRRAAQAQAHLSPLLERNPDREDLKTLMGIASYVITRRS